MDTLDEYVLFLLIVLPLAGAGVLLLVPSHRPGVTRWISAVLSFAVMLLGFYVFAFYDHEAGGYQFLRAWEWLRIPGPWEFGERGITLSLGADGISAMMALLTGIVMFTGTLISWNVAERNKDFFVLYFLLLSGVFGVFVSLDLFFLFFFYELAVLPMYLLIGVWGSSSTFKTFVRTKEYGAMKLMLFLVAGSVLIWVALLWIFVEANAGTFDLQVLSEVQFSPAFQRVLFPFLMVGFGVLAGLWPFHTWSPDGHVAAPSAVSMVHAGVLMKLGAYGIIRVGMTLLPDGAQDWMPILVTLGAVNVIYGAMSAMGQRDLKYVIGYSSVSHMGYVIMGLATLNHLGLSGAVMQMFSHGVMTALFFTRRSHLRTHPYEGHRSAGRHGQADDDHGLALRNRGIGVTGTTRAQWVRGGTPSLHRAVPNVSYLRGSSHRGRGHHCDIYPAPHGKGILRRTGPTVERPHGHLAARGSVRNHTGSVHLLHGTLPISLLARDRRRRRRTARPRNWRWLDE